VTSVEILRAVLQDLGELQARMVFTGGLVLPLYLQRTPALRLRPTKDADAVVGCTTYVEWMGLQAELMASGTLPVADPDAPIWRMRTPGGYLLDVMPFEPAALGFGNRWFRGGFERAVPADLGLGTTVRIFPPTLYAAAKGEAYNDRGQADPWTSHDLEDLLTLVACRPSLPDEIALESESLRRFLAEVATNILAIDQVDDLIAGNVGEPEDALLHTLGAIRALGGVE
jgi:hypothetical protein